jgi:hypothetical protein
MGTTLHAIIEEFHPAREIRHSDGQVTSTLAGWHEVGTWAFGKNYELSGYLHEHAEKHWPRESAALEKACYETSDQDRQWCSVQVLETALVDLDGRPLEDGETRWYRLDLAAMLAAIRTLVADGLEIRVLWFRS